MQQHNKYENSDTLSYNMSESKNDSSSTKFSPNSCVTNRVDHRWGYRGVCIVCLGLSMGRAHQSQT